MKCRSALKRISSRPHTRKLLLKSLLVFVHFGDDHWNVLYANDLTMVADSMDEVQTTLQKGITFKK